MIDEKKIAALNDDEKQEVWKQVELEHTKLDARTVAEQYNMSLSDEEAEVIALTFLHECDWGTAYIATMEDIVKQFNNLCKGKSSRYDFGYRINNLCKGPKPTEKQKDFAMDIAEVLKINLPAINTKKAYSKFIGDHIDAYQKEIETNPLYITSDWELQYI